MLPSAKRTNTSTTLDITILILTYNEELHIERAIASVKGFAKEIIVVDSFSTDGTPGLAQAAGARVLQNKFINYSKQFQWGLDRGSIKTEWVMRLDADEVVSQHLSENLCQLIPQLKADVVGINLDRRHIFMGRWVRYGGRYPLTLLRIWRTKNGRIEDRWMDEHIVTWGGITVSCPGYFDDENLNDISFFIDKHNKYAVREAIDVINQRYALFERDTPELAKGASFQAGAKRFIKENLYNKSGFFAAPLAYFILRYFFQLGFLDGRTGLVYHFMQGFWYRFLVNVKVLEFDNALKDCTSNEQRIAALEKVTKRDFAQITRSSTAPK